MTNLNLLFNKTYYDCLGKKNENEWFNKCNHILFHTTFAKDDYVESPLEILDGFTGFYMQTAYPGMLIGTGYAHGSHLKGANEDINIGFSFDYTSGQPYIPGSSVKGVIRSMFRQKDVLQPFLAECIGTDAATVDTNALEIDIFDNGRDTFLDAVLASGDQKGRCLGEDYITPHKEEIKEPLPIKQLKILPNVCFEFRFILKDSVDEQGKVILSAAQKKELFSALLEVSGAGAKTNVGYGALTLTDQDTVRNRRLPLSEPPFQHAEKKRKDKKRYAPCGNRNG